MQPGRLPGESHRPKRHESDDHFFREGMYQHGLDKLSSDACKRYLEAVDLAFRRYVKCGQLIKD